MLSSIFYFDIRLWNSKKNSEQDNYEKSKTETEIKIQDKHFDIYSKPVNNEIFQNPNIKKGIIECF